MRMLAPGGGGQPLGWWSVETVVPGVPWTALPSDRHPAQTFEPLLLVLCRAAKPTLDRKA